jgi:hypothetical protein
MTLQDFSRKNFTVKREWSDKGVAIVFNVATARYWMLAGRNNPSLGGVEHVTTEAVLGSREQLNLLAAVKTAGNLLSGVVCVDDVVSMRDSRCPSILSIGHSI